MRKSLLIALAAFSAFAADDGWTKVRDLKSGTEIRIVKRAAKTPVIAKMDELTDDNLVVVVRNEQIAIPREQIDRIDARPPQKGSRVTRETKSKQEISSEGRPTSSYSSGLSIGDKPDFETIYRRRPAPPPAAPKP